jgi:hypothetical protein
MVSAILVVSLWVTQRGPAADLKLMTSEENPNCSLVAEHFSSRAHPEAKREVWLRATAGAPRRVLLTTYERNAETLFSPDCSTVALNDNLGSDVAEVRLFRLVGKLRYQPMRRADPTAKAWQLFRRIYAVGDSRSYLMHAYVNALAWSSDSQALLLRVWGHTDEANNVGAWFCVYDVAKNDASVDLQLMNRNSVVVRGKVK